VHGSWMAGARVGTGQVYRRCDGNAHYVHCEFRAGAGRVQGRCRVQGARCRVQGAGCRAGSGQVQGRCRASEGRVHGRCRAGAGQACQRLQLCSLQFSDGDCEHHPNDGTLSVVQLMQHSSRQWRHAQVHPRRVVARPANRSRNHLRCSRGAHGRGRAPWRRPEPTRTPCLGGGGGGCTCCSPRWDSSTRPALRGSGSTACN
jgi:hypothetical protein